MFQIHIPAIDDYWDESKEEFVSINSCDLVLEHSLISISKWESKWKVPFLTNSNRTNEQLIDYIRCMTITQNVDPKVYEFIPQQEIMRIQDYINDDHTATFFKDDGKKRGGHKEILTSEVIYYFMIALQIPMECQKWHLGRLMTLIKVCNEKNKEADPKNRKKKLTTKEQMDLATKYDEINERRKKELGTRG